MKAIVAAFKQVKALVWAFSVIVQLRRWIGTQLYSWSPLNDKSVGGGDQTNGHDVFRVKLAHMDSSDGDITDNDREDSKDLLIEHRPRNGTGQGPCTLNTSLFNLNCIVINCDFSFLGKSQC